MNRDSVKVRVVDHVTLELGNDFKSCEGDTVHINSTTDALKFSWTPAATINDANAKNVVASPAGTTTYQLTAFISSCSASDEYNGYAYPIPGSKCRSGYHHLF
jgi:hypothetical protein